MKKKTFQIFLIIAVALTGCKEKNELRKYPAVHEESHHQIVYENEGTRILEVATEPGDSCAYHCHSECIAYVALSGTKLRLDSLNGSSRTVTLPTGWTSMDTTYPSKKMCHRFSNIGSQALLIYAIEFFDEMQLRSYSWQWETVLVAETSSFFVPANSLLFYEADSLQITSDIKPTESKDWIMIPKQDTVHVQKLGAGKQQFYVLNWI